MLKLLVNIRGCNGAGKSTIPMQMLESDPDAAVYTDKNGTKFTVFPALGWVALGKYSTSTKTGGMDTISTKAEKQALLRFLWRNYPDFDILMEGVIDATIFSTYVELFDLYKRRIEAREVSLRKIIVLSLLPPVEVCIARVYERNGGKPINEDAVISKWNTVHRNMFKFRKAGIISKMMNTAKIHKEDMLETFLAFAEVNREG